MKRGPLRQVGFEIDHRDASGRNEKTTKKLHNGQGKGTQYKCEDVYELSKCPQDKMMDLLGERKVCEFD